MRETSRIIWDAKEKAIAACYNEAAASNLVSCIRLHADDDFEVASEFLDCARKAPKDSPLERRVVFCFADALREVDRRHYGNTSLLRLYRWAGEVLRKDAPARLVCTHVKDQLEAFGRVSDLSTQKKFLVVGLKHIDVESDARKNPVPYVPVAPRDPVNVRRTADKNVVSCAVRGMASVP